MSHPERLYDVEIINIQAIENLTLGTFNGKQFISCWVKGDPKKKFV
jgi:hypothetical protein